MVDDDEGFAETSGGTLMSQDSGRGESIRDRHPSGTSIEQSQPQGNFLTTFTKVAI